VATPSARPIANSKVAFLAPSWSWLSATSPVHYRNAVRGDDSQFDAGAHKFTDLEALSNIALAESETLFGATGIRGTLVIHGPSFDYCLTTDDLKKTVFKSWNAATLNLNTGRWLLDGAIELPIDLQCIIVAEDAVAKMLICLCLVPDKQHTDKLRRVGLCHWEGLAWQVAKFVGKEPEERKFTII
jgi:hypothetical protein